MKPLLLIAALLVPLLAASQALPIDTTTKKVTYTAVVKSDSFSKAQLYMNAKQWFIQNFKSAKDVIQLDDQANGRIIGKGFTAIDTYKLNYTIDIAVKDGRYRYVISDFMIQNNPNRYGADNYTLEYTMNLDGNKNKDGTYKSRYIKFLDPLQHSINDLIVSLTSALNKKAGTDF